VALFSRRLLCLEFLRPQPLLSAGLPVTPTIILQMFTIANEPMLPVLAPSDVKVHVFEQQALCNDSVPLALAQGASRVLPELQECSM
jgi:hypothetical protein